MEVVCGDTMARGGDITRAPAAPTTWGATGLVVLAFSPSCPAGQAALADGH